MVIVFLVTSFACERGVNSPIFACMKNKDNKERQACRQTLKFKALESKSGGLKDQDASADQDVQEQRVMAQTMAGVGRKTEAMDVLQKLHAKNPKDTKILMDIAQLYADLSLPDRTLATLDLVVKIEPTNARAHFLRGLTLKVMNRVSEEIEAYKTALEYDDELAEAYHNLGIALKKTGQHKEADKNIAKSLEVWDAMEEETPDLYTEHKEIKSFLDRMRDYLGI